MRFLEWSVSRIEMQPNEFKRIDLISLAHNNNDGSNNNTVTKYRLNEQ